MTRIYDSGGKGALRATMTPGACGAWQSRKKSDQTTKEYAAAVTDPVRRPQGCDIVKWVLQAPMLLQRLAA